MEKTKEIYLDNRDTTKISEAALKKYIDVSREIYGNPSSLHSMGHAAERELREARRAILETLAAKDAKVVFTASGSEANNLAIFGRAFAKERYRKGKIITTLGEHASVSEPLKKLSELGFKVAYIPTRNGKIDLEELTKEMTSDVILVTVMMVNNETGALYDTAEVSRIMRRNSPEALLHIDATQSYLKIPFTMKNSGADMITVSSHKIEGPKGAGALIIDQKIEKAKGLTPLTLGGGQESGYRSGTENVPAIAAFAAAATEAYKSLRKNYEELNGLRSYLIEKLESTDALAEISPTLPEHHAPHILNITLPKIKSETMLHYLSSLGIYVSSGSACSSNSAHLSTALTAYGRSNAEADTSVRISFAPHNTKADIDALCDALADGLKKLARIR